MTPLELAANAVTALSIWLAARNSVLTWPVGIVGCTLFGFQFFESRLYADTTLQVFFAVTSLVGWVQWRAVPGFGERRQRPISRVPMAPLAGMALAAVCVAAAYGALLHRFTDAWMPYLDSAVLALSVMGQYLLMQRRLETWPVWIVVNTLSVPLYASRGLWLTAALYAAFWFNAWYGWWRWQQELAAPVEVRA